MTSRDDATRAAVAPMLADLRSDLLVLPPEPLVERHVEMMVFEQQVLATPRFVQQKTRRTMPHPRRALIAFVCAFSTLVSCGLSAAGALPAPLQHITDSIAHTLGVPHPDHAPQPSKGAAAGAPAAVKPVESPTPATPPKTVGQSAPAPVKAAPAASKPAVVPTTTSLPPLPGATTQIAPPRPRVPSPRITPVDAGPPPLKNSSNTPPGYPSDWRSQATAAAAAQLAWACTQATTLTQTGCPQEATATGVNASAQSVEWTLLNDPFAGAAVVAKTKAGDPAKHIAPTTTITVYLAFQMEARYTEADGSGPYLAYSGGIAAATMIWKDSQFVNVSFSLGSVAGHLLPGVKAPSIPHPANVDNSVVLGAVQAGFNACTAITPPVAGATIPSCPQPNAAGELWTMTGDPTQAAVVAFDSQQGLFTVTGTYAMTSNQGRSDVGAYAATLFFDGTQLQLLSITAT